MGQREKIAKLEALLVQVQARAKEPRHLRLVEPVAAAEPLVAAAPAPASVKQAPVAAAPAPASVKQAAVPPSVRTPSPKPAPVVEPSGRPTPITSAPPPIMTLEAEVTRPVFAAGPPMHLVGTLQGQTLAEILRDCLTK